MIAGNWKMYKTPGEAAVLAQDIDNLLGYEKDIAEKVEVVVCPPFVDLKPVATVIEFDASPVKLAAQDVYWETEGAYTGETSPLMLKAVGATQIIIGHSERRQYFGETDEMVNQKILSAVKHCLTPIICVGETLEEREAGNTEEVLLRQCQIAFKGVEPEDAESFVIAYEPVWAIGTGRTATPEMAGLAHFHIRSQVARLLGRKAADSIRILYGGSVKPDNASALANQPEIDGALVGGSSLDPVSFAKIVNY